MNGTLTKLRLCLPVALALVTTTPDVRAQFVDFIDFGSTSGKLNDVDGSIANVTAFNGNPFSVSYSPDSIDFGGSTVVGANSGVFLTLDGPNSVELSGVQDAVQRLQVDVTIGAGNEAEDLTVQLSDTLFDAGYAYQFNIANLGPGQHTLFSPVLNAGAQAGSSPLDYNNDVIDQVTFFSGNFVAGVPQAVDISVDSLSLFTPTPVAPGRVEFGLLPDQLAYSNGGLSGNVDDRGAGFGGTPAPTPLPDPVSTSDGLRFFGNVPANSLVGHGVEITEGVDISPPGDPLSGTDELVLEIVVGANNEVRDIIFEIIATTGPGQGDLSQKSWFLSGIQDLAPGTHVISALTFDDGTNNQGVFPFDPAEGDLVDKVVLFGFNAQNELEPEFEDVTDKQLDITIKSVSFGLDVGPLPGDFNGDGSVDAADYTVWRDNFNGPESALSGNGNGNSTVDQGDYTLWSNNFGNMSAPASAVPEPTTAAFAVLAMAGVALRRRQF